MPVTQKTVKPLTEADLAPPAPWRAPPRVFLNATPAVPPPEVWPVREADFEEVLAWLVPRLRGEWPRLSVDGLVSELREAMRGRGALFLRTRHVVGYFRAARTILEPLVPLVEEVFVRSRETAHREGALLYLEARAWAMKLGAREFRFNVDSDVAMTNAVVPELTETGGKVFKTTVFIQELGR